MAGHNAVGTPSGARRCSADGKIALGLQSQTSVRQAARPHRSHVFEINVRDRTLDGSLTSALGGPVTANQPWSFARSATMTGIGPTPRLFSSYMFIPLGTPSRSVFQSPAVIGPTDRAKAAYAHPQSG